MALVSVIYQSRKEYVRLMAEEIGTVCGVHPVDINIPQVLAFPDLLFVGMGAYGGHLDASIMDYLDQIPSGTVKGAAIFSASASGIDHTALAVNLLEHKGITIYPRHLIIPTRNFFFHRVSLNEEEKAQCTSFAREVIEAFNA